MKHVRNELIAAPCLMACCLIVASCSEIDTPKHRATPRTANVFGAEVLLATGNDTASSIWITIRNIAVKRLTKGKLAATKPMIRKWCENYARTGGLKNEDLFRMVATERAILRQLLAELSAPQSRLRPRTRPNQQVIAGDEVVLARFRAVFPTVTSVKERLAELEAFKPAEAFWRKEAIVMLGVRQVVVGIYGKHVLTVKDSEMARERLRYQEIHMKPYDDEVLVQILVDRKAGAFMRKHILAEIKGGGITFSNESDESAVVKYLSSE